MSVSISLPLLQILGHTDLGEVHIHLLVIHSDAPGVELLTNKRAHSSKSANDKVIPELFNSLHGAPPRKNLVDFPFDHQLSAGKYCIADHSYAREYDEQRENFSGKGQFVNFPEADGGNRNDRHVKAVEQRPPLDEPITSRPKEKDQHNAYEGLNDGVTMYQCTYPLSHITLNRMQFP